MKPFLLCAALALAACSSTPMRPATANDDEFRFGPLVAATRVNLKLDRSGLEPEPRAATAADYGWTVALDGDDDMLLLRADYSHSEHDFEFGPGQAEFDLATVHVLAGPIRIGGRDFRVTPLIGVGTGYARFHPTGVAIEGDSGFLVAVAGGVDVEILRHGFVQALVSAGLFGDPGDTEGTTLAVSVGGGLRF